MLVVFFILGVITGLSYGYIRRKIIEKKVAGTLAAFKFKKK